MKEHKNTTCDPCERDFEKSVEELVKEGTTPSHADREKKEHEVKAAFSQQRTAEHSGKQCTSQYAAEGHSAQGHAAEGHAAKGDAGRESGRNSEKPASDQQSDMPGQSGQSGRESKPGQDSGMSGQHAGMTSQQSGLDSIYTQPLEREITEGDTARKHPMAGDMTEE